jgi:hypothetical protein
LAENVSGQTDVVAFVNEQERSITVVREPINEELVLTIHRRRSAGCFSRELNEYCKYAIDADLSAAKDE